MREIWIDNRSGTEGKATGNMVLNHIIAKTKEKLVHKKGTVFLTPTSVFVGRICASDEYLTGNIVHFCNLSETQHKSLSKYSKKHINYLFITVFCESKQVHYWLVPGTVIGKVLSTLNVKESSPSSIVRIVHDDKNAYRIGNVNIARYHEQLPLPKRHRKSQLVA